MAFDALFKAGASSVVDSVVPDLLQKLERGKESDQALEGLKVILSIRPHTFEAIMPRLLKEPITAIRLAALTSLIEVAPGSLRAHVPQLSKTLMKLGSEMPIIDRGRAAQEAAEKVDIAISTST